MAYTITSAGDEEATKSWYKLRVSLIQEFNYVIGEDKHNLRNWQKMFSLIGLAEASFLRKARTISLGKPSVLSQPRACLSTSRSLRTEPVIGTGSQNPIASNIQFQNLANWQNGNLATKDSPANRQEPLPTTTPAPVRARTRSVPRLLAKYP
ncbi:hypothetical protein FOXYSP1_03476 [Fusarium oxysporum f. sp. phaseoli]